MRPGDRGSDAERGDEYGDYDYAADGYRGGDDEWSPEEYFSPEGIKGNWAGQHPEGRSGGRGQQRDGASYANSGRGERAEPAPTNAGYPNRPSFTSRDAQGREPAEYGTDGYRGGGQSGYGSDEYATGAYELPEGADGERPERGRRRRKERDGERTGILWLRRDRGEDIWPDDDVSDEDYWASVASDRPLSPGGSPAAADDLLTRPAPPSDPRGPARGVTGRLGPAPGAAGDGQPGGSGPGLGGPGTGRMSSGPMAARSQSGPMAARSPSGPNAIRIGSGPLPSVGVTSSRPPTGPIPRSAPSRPGSTSGGFSPAAPRPSFQPNGYQPGTPASPRAQDRSDRGDWGERTERIERVNADGYPDPRPSGRDNPPPAPRGEPRRDPGEGSGAWPVPGRNGAGSGAHARNRADDPLTSAAYSRSIQPETDGRSYRAASRLSQAQPKLTEQAETFITGQYPTGDYPTVSYQAAEQWTGEQRAVDRPTGTGEYWLYRDDAPSPLPRPAQSHPGQPQPRPSRSGQPPLSQPPAGPPPTGRYSGYSTPQAPSTPAPQAHRSQPGQGQPPRNSGRVSLPGTGSFPNSPYDTGSLYEAQSRPAQPSPSQPPAANVPAAGAPPLSAPTPARPGAPGGPNPYDSSITGSHPYPAQSYSVPSAPAGTAPDGADNRYYRPAAPENPDGRNPERGRPGPPPGYSPRDNRY